MGKLHLTLEKGQACIGHGKIDTHSGSDIMKALVGIGESMHPAAPVTDDTLRTYKETTDGRTSSTRWQVTGDRFHELCGAIGKTGVLELLDTGTLPDGADGLGTDDMRLVFWYTVS